MNSSRLFTFHRVRLLKGLAVYCFLEKPRQFYLRGEVVKRSRERLIKPIIKAAAQVPNQRRGRDVHVTSAFLLVANYRAVLG